MHYSTATSLLVRGVKQGVILDSRFDDCVVQNDGRMGWITLNQLAVVARTWNISFLCAKRVPTNGRNAAWRRS